MNDVYKYITYFDDILGAIHHHDDAGISVDIPMSINNIYNVHCHIK